MIRTPDNTRNANGRIWTHKPCSQWHICFQDSVVITISVRWQNAVCRTRTYKADVPPDRLATGSNTIMGTLQIGKTHSIQKVLSKRNKKLRVSCQNWFRCTSYYQPFCCTFLFLTYIVPKNIYDRPYILNLEMGKRGIEPPLFTA